MKVLRELTSKPWLQPDASTGASAATLRGQTVAATAVWFYIGVATVMFSLIIVVYVLRLGNYGADPEAAAAAISSMAWWTLSALCGIPPADDWTPMAEPRLLWVNTGVLVLSSIAWQTARADAARGRMDALRNALIAGGALAVIFLIGQLTVWRSLVASGEIATANPANAFFYLITAMHGLHLIGGLFFWGRTTAHVMQGAKAAEVATSVNLCAVYWHYLLLIWVLMFGLLLIT